MVVYTCVIDGYDKISELNHYDSNTKYICFYDKEVNKIGPWEYVKVSDSLGGLTDPFYRSRYFRILPYKFFDINDKLVWIDAGRIHTKKFIEASRQFFSKDIPLAFLGKKIPHKSFLESVESNYLKKGLISPSEIINYCKVLSDLGWSFKKPPIVSFVIWMNGINVSYCDFWWDLFLKGPKRDLISMLASLEICEMKYMQIPNLLNEVISDKGDHKLNRLKPYNWSNTYSDDEIQTAISYIKKTYLTK